MTFSCHSWEGLGNLNVRGGRDKNKLNKMLLLREDKEPQSVSQFSCSVVSDSLRPHESQHARPPCSSLTPRVDSNSCPLSRWCHPAISPSVIPFSSCSQSLPASGSFPMSQLFAWGGQSIGVSASASVLPMNTQDWSSLGWNGWTSLQSRKTLKSLLQHHSSKASILRHSGFFIVCINIINILYLLIRLLYLVRFLCRLLWLLEFILLGKYSVNTVL